MFHAQYGEQLAYDPSMTRHAQDVRHHRSMRRVGLAVRPISKSHADILCRQWSRLMRRTDSRHDVYAHNMLARWRDRWERMYGNSPPGMVSYAYGASGTYYTRLQEGR